MVRRGWGEGSITKRVVKRTLKDGTVREYVYTRVLLPGGLSGRRREFQNRSERVARAWLKANIGRVSRGFPIEGERMTLGAYAVDWLADTRRNVAPATADFYRHSLRHLEPIADMPIAAVAPAHVRGLIAQGTDSGLSSRTVRGIVQTLRLVLRRAEGDGLVERNVAALVKLPKLEQAEPQHFTPEQARRFLDVVSEDALVSLYAVALGTGLRRGELVGLQWRDVDLELATLRVGRAKTAAGVRTIPLAPFVARYLAHLERHPGPIWHVSPDYVSRHFKEVCQQAGLPYIKFHGLRHTAASLMLDAGVDPLVIQQVLGHTKVSMTGHYARSGDELRRDAVERLGGTIAGNSRVANVR